MRWPGEPSKTDLGVRASNFTRSYSHASAASPNMAPLGMGHTTSGSRRAFSKLEGDYKAGVSLEYKWARHNVVSHPKIELETLEPCSTRFGPILVSFTDGLCGSGRTTRKAH